MNDLGIETKEVALALIYMCELMNGKQILGKGKLVGELMNFRPEILKRLWAREAEVEENLYFWLNLHWVAE